MNDGGPSFRMIFINLAVSIMPSGQSVRYPGIDTIIERMMNDAVDQRFMILLLFLLMEIPMMELITSLNERKKGLSLNRAFRQF